MATGENTLSKDEQNDLVTGVARSTSYNIVLQLMLRISTFVINAIVLRHVTKDLLGIVNVRLTLLYSTTLFIGRESFRRSCMSKTDASWQEIVNIIWFAPMLGLGAAIVLSYLWLFHLKLPDAELHFSYTVGVVCFSLSAVLEMLSEPVYIIGQKLLYVRFAALLEGAALILKSIVTIVLVLLYPQMAILIFCFAQLSFTLVYTCGYFIYFGYLTAAGKPSFPLRNIRQFFPNRTESGIVINRQLASLVWSFQKQSFLKQLLTEGERYIMTVFNILSFADQGVFDVISNLGSLVARFLFRPIEDSSYLLFSYTIVRGTSATQQDKESLHTATEALTQLLKLLTLTGLTILVFGYNYAHLALHVYGGQVLSVGAGPYLLRWYSVYVLLMAVNGLTECFSFATMSKPQLDRFNYKMLAFSIGFLAASLVFTSRFGSAGFIMANCCNLILRIIHSVYIIEKFYEGTSEYPIINSLLDSRVLIVYSVAFILTSTSRVWFGGNALLPSLLHILTGVTSLTLILAAIYTYEKRAVTFIINKFISPLIKSKAA
ncbi:man(5)GlcNAc(2)-PP-dolichol translocation protein RFT1-like [Watersipora subatra]|uniref:man(5)GlcNAc(2)-PP-dolichol translocation protein RFT1-like n=1 Tax=Watersipora subatra TaxID=2589382 RepID=UPI00355C2146